MDVGVFIPIGNNGWLISTNSPQYKPSFDLNREIVQKAEAYHLDFALSMIKLRGFGGPSEYWDHNLESFTLMAGLAAVTQRIKLYASVAVLTIPPAIVARMAVTIDSISHGRFGVNLVTGWQKAEYDQMGLWPGEAHYSRRYDYLAEYVHVLRDLWTTGHSDFKGQFFTMNDCRLSPQPQTPIELVCAGQSDNGMAFASAFTDYNFCGGGDWINTPLAAAPNIARLAAANRRSDRAVGAYLLIMVIADSTDEAAMAKWQHYVAGTDMEALRWQAAQAGADTKAPENSTAGRLRLVADDPATAVPTRMSRLIGSYASVARMLDQLAEIDGLAGIMLTFDDFLIGMEQFGRHIQPLMTSRASVPKPS